MNKGEKVWKLHERYAIHTAEQYIKSIGNLCPPKEEQQLAIFNGAAKNIKNY